METWTHPDAEPRRHPAAGQAPPPPPGYHPRPPSLIGGIMRSLAGHMIFSGITSAIGFNLLGIPLAIILWVMGWQVGLPGHVKENVQGFFHRITGATSGEKDEVMETLSSQREATEETPRPQEQRLAERFYRGEPQAEPDGPPQHADDLAAPGRAILGETLGRGGPPGAAAANRRARPSPRESPTRPADAPAGGDYLRGLGLKAWAEGLGAKDFDEPPTDK